MSVGSKVCRCCACRPDACLSFKTFKTFKELKEFGMVSIAFAVGVLVWLWAAVMRHVVERLAGSASPMQQRVYLIMAVLVGTVVLVAIVGQVLPQSMLSAGWGRELVVQATKSAGLVAGVTAVAALWRAHLMMPMLPVHGSIYGKARKAGLSSSPKLPEKTKRRP